MPGSHGDKIQYVDCYRCRDHPAFPPEDFWGTQPDDEPQVPTADELGLPFPEEPAKQIKDKGKGKPKKKNKKTFQRDKIYDTKASQDTF